MAKPEPNSDAPPSFEASLSQLQAIVFDLEGGSLGLDESLARFEQGIRLLRECYQTLSQAEQKIEMLVAVDADGQPVLEPLETSATFAETESSKKPRRKRAERPPPEPADQPEPLDDNDAQPTLF